jgi:hypothetical protein
MKRNYLTAILNELESIKFYAVELDKQLRKKKLHTGDLDYAFEKLEDIRIFLEPTDKSY